MATLKHPIREAERYLENAREILSTKAEKQGQYYLDKKYVKMAGNTAWNGVLVALDAVLHVSENRKKDQRLSFNDFENALAKRDRKMPSHLHSAYEVLHKFMGYDGTRDYKIVKVGMERAKMLIVWSDKHYSESL
jgi:hypothetical protein